VATTIAEVSDRMTLLVREEIELAKAEVVTKVTKLLRGAIVGAAAGIFVLAAVLFALHGFAWLLYFELPIGNSFSFFWGFFILAAILLLLGAVAGVIAAKLVKKASPPTPTMAIDEAKKIRETVSAGADGAA
jgi:uncharacterized membrane protein required for colicin V production